MKRYLWFTLIVVSLSGLVLAQSIPVKPSPAVDSLNAAAKDYATSQKTLADAVAQARQAMEASQKNLSLQLQDASKKLNDQLHQDKKYKGELEKIDSLQKQIQSVQQSAQAQFDKQNGPLQGKVNQDKATIDSLVLVVRKENELGDSATFDPLTQSWIEGKK